MSRRRTSTLLLVLALVLAGVTVIVPVAAAQASLSAVAPQPIASGLDQPTLSALAVARDGSGGLVYSAQSGGIEHVFLSRLADGTFAAPVQLDPSGLAGAGQPVIAAANGGQLLVAFVSQNTLYAAASPGAGQPLSAPVALAGAAADPSISLNASGQGYLAFTQSVAGGTDVDVMVFSSGSWAPASPEAMNATPGDGAGTGTGAPSVVAATDGVGIVAWGEAGHVFSRRLLGSQTSVEVEQDDVPGLDGLPELSSGAPRIASGGDSSYPDIVFSESFGSASDPSTRAMLTRLVAEQTQPAVPVDGITGAGQDATEAAVAMGELGRGVISVVDATASPGSAAGAGPPDGVVATPLAPDGIPATPVQLTPAPDPVDPQAAAAALGSDAAAVAWEQGPAPSQILVADAPDGVSFAPPVAVSSNLGGPVQPDGLGLGGDSRGDVAAAWLQGAPGDITLEAAALLTPPGQPGLAPSRVLARTSQPTLSWRAAAEDWGPVTYAVSVDGGVPTQTTATQITLPAAVSDGTYSWQVSATNAAGQTTVSRAGTLIVDTTAPHLRVVVDGSPRVRAPQRLRVRALDAPNPAEPAARASGVAGLRVLWGDGTSLRRTRIPGQLIHRYLRPGLYRLRVTVTDRVGNATSLTRLIRILP